jgi:hypothetical protein
MQEWLYGLCAQIFAPRLTANWEERVKLHALPWELDEMGDQLHGCTTAATGRWMGL